MALTLARSYRQFANRNGQLVNSIDGLLRSLTYILPGIMIMLV